MERQEGVVAFILVITEVGREFDVLERIRRLASELEVNAEAYVVYGEYDLAVKVVASNTSKLNKFVTALRSQPGILRTLTLVSA